MTLMVRDEADIIAAMLDHHIKQGVDLFIATDNGSVDGTAEILQTYADRGLVDLRHDPVHRKQQGVVVTQMARDAATIHGADWVLNADADEFWLPKEPGVTLHEVFSQIEPKIQAFLVDVIDMTGPPALSGTGLQRLCYRDQRTIAELNAVGLHSHSTPNAVHVGDPHISVVQGNHLVSLQSLGSPPRELSLEVLHFPWRSWEQFSRKVGNAGRAYLNSSGLTPSPNHHGMRDYQRLLSDTLYPSYLYRHPTRDSLAAGLATGSFVLDSRISESITSPVDDHLPDDEASRDWKIGEVIGNLEFQITQLNADLADQRVRHEEVLAELQAREIDHTAQAGALANLAEREAEVRSLLQRIQARRIVRLTDRLAQAFQRRARRE